MDFIKRVKKAKLFGVTWWYWFYPLKWGSFLRGTYNKDSVPFEFCEIVVYRSLMCPDCMKNGSCIVCGCDVPAKMMDLSADCEINNWNATTVEQWREYKKRTGLKFKVEYGG